MAAPPKNSVNTQTLLNIQGNKFVPWTLCFSNTKRVEFWSVGFWEENKRTFKSAAKLYEPPKAAYKLVRSQHNQLLNRKQQIGTNMIYGWKQHSSRGWE